MISKKDYALNYFNHGFKVIPLCWAEDGKCACFMEHKNEKLIGKAPLVKYANVEITGEKIEEWFTKFPKANIGILIKESGLVIIDADSTEAVKEVETTWFNPEMIPSVKTGRGKHFYFRANSSTPINRVIHVGKSQMIDVFSRGILVAPPSTHKNGHQYQWINPPKKTGIPNIPKWIEDKFLTKKPVKSNVKKPKIHITGQKERININNLPLNDFVKSIIKLGKLSPYYEERGYVSPSEALHGMIISCFQRGLSENQIYNIFTNPMYALSYKYHEYDQEIRKFKDKTPEEWLEDEIARAEAKVLSRKKAKKNSRFNRTTTGDSFNSIQANQTERIINQ